ncbi:MAG: thiamine phosphate synthase [Mycobacteriales bacterium]
MNRDERLGRLRRARLYLCTQSRPQLSSFLDAALAGGVDAVQLREKGLEAAREIELLGAFAGAARRHGALWSVNDRADLAHAVDPDLLHLGQQDLPVAVARDIVGPQVLIGLSTHDPQQVARAAADPEVDYFCVGPVWPTPTKPGRPAPGLSLLTHAARVAGGKPWFAIGGIDAARLEHVLEAGATRVVVVRAITEAADPGRAAGELAARLAAASRA